MKIPYRRRGRKAAAAEKMLVVGAAEIRVRVLPPLTVTDAEITEGINRLTRALSALPQVKP